MTEPKPVPRVYGEQEIGRILQRATELQHKEPSASSSGGMTLAELEEIAAEAGIDASFLRRAAIEVDSGLSDTSFWARIAGEELMLVREVTLPGELAADGFERIVSTIQTHSREHGQPSLLGRTLTWRAETASKMRTIQIVVVSRDGTTQLRLEENLSQLASGLFGGLMGGVGGGLGFGLGMPAGFAMGSVLFAVVAPIGVGALAFVGARAAYRRTVAGRRRAIAELFERTVAEAQTSIDASTVTQGKRSNALPPPE